MEKSRGKMNLKDMAYTIIREKIVNCEYMPNQFMTETELTEMIGVSRTPIREAINKLEQEGLVQVLPKRGIMIKEITVGTINDMFEIRILVEPYLVETYGKDIPKEEIKRQLEIAADDTVLFYGKNGFRKDNELHQLFYSASHNSYFEEIMHRSYALNQRMRILSGMRSEERIRETQEEHYKILESMLNKEFAQAAQYMKEHLKNSRQAAVEAMLQEHGEKINRIII